MRERVCSRRAWTASGRGTLVALFVLLVGVMIPVHAQTEAGRLSADDYAEILQLYFQYPLLLDSGDAEGYADLFTVDGSFNDRVGRQALLDFVRNRQPSTIRHAPLTPIITATAEGARGVVLNMFVDVGQTPAVITRVSQYTDTLVRTPEGWRFQTRVNGSAELAPPAGTPGSAGVAGTWSGDVPLPNGTRLPFVAHLAVEGTRVTGVLDGIGGAPDVTIEEGMVTGTTVTFTGVRDIQGEPVRFFYTGELDGETLTFTIVRDGDDGPPLMSVTRRVAGS